MKTRNFIFEGTPKLCAYYKDRLYEETGLVVYLMAGLPLAGKICNMGKRIFFMDARVIDIRKINHLFDI